MSHRIFLPKDMIKSNDLIRESKSQHSAVKLFFHISGQVQINM